MAGPWEEFQTNSAPGPWQEFQQQATPEPYQPSLLERMSEGVKSVGRSAAPAFEKLNRLYSPVPSSGDITTPGGAVAEGMNTAMSPVVRGLGGAMSAATQGLNQAGEYVAEKSGKMGLPPGVGGTLGFIAANAPLAALPTPGLMTRAGGRILGPTVPASRAAAVGAAERLGVPLTRAEMTGSRSAATAENLLEKTPMGSPPLQEFRTGQMEALQRAKTGLQERMGTQEDLYGVGEKAQRGQASRTQAMNVKRREMFEKVPEDVTIPLGKSESMADQVLKEQRGYTPNTQNPDVISIAEDIKGIQAGISKGDPNWAAIKRVREVLDTRITANNKGIQAGLPGQANAVARDYQRLKSALDQDINAFGTQGLGDLPITQPGSKTGKPHALFSYTDEFGEGGAKRDVYNVYGDPNDPILKQRGWGSSVSKEDLDAAGIPITGREPKSSEFIQSGKGEFAKEYRKANAFSGAYQGLFKADDALSIAKSNPERIVDMIFKKNNETDIKRFRAIVGDEGFQSVKQKFTQDILESPNVETELGKYKPGTLQAIFTKPELDQIRDYAATQDLTKTVGRVQGTQGSARSNLSTAQYGGLYTGLATAGGLFGSEQPIAALGTAAAAVGQFVAPRYLSKGYLSEFSRRGLSTAVRPGFAKAGEKAAIYGTFIDRITTKRGQND